MHTIIVDAQKRIRLPEAKPGQVYSMEDNGDGSIMLVQVKPVPRTRPFDPHLYDDLEGDRLALEQKLAEASAKVDVSSEERDRR